MRRPLIFTLFLFVIFSLYLLMTDRNTVNEPDLATSKDLNRYLFDNKKANRYALKTDKPDLAMQEEVAIRSAVGGEFSYVQGYRFKAMQDVKKFRSGVLRKTAELNWVERGPGNVGGRTRSIIVHPEDVNTWLVAAVGGGIWKTEDAGQSWRCVTDDLPVLSATTLAVCSSAPSVMYAGTGEGFYNGDAIIGDGVFKSTDEGETWQQLASTASNYDFRYVNRIIVDPGNPDLVLAATNSGLYRTVDGGVSWTEVFNEDLRVQQIIANPYNFNTQFIAVDGRGNTSTYAGGIYKSTDAGMTWQHVSEEIQNHYRIEMAISEADTSVLYASPVNSDYGLLGFFRSGDAGESWTDYGNSTNWLGGQGWYDNALVVSPLDPDVVIVGGIDVYRVTINGGSMSTEKLSHWYSGAGYPYVHADQHYFVTLQDGPNNFAIIAANDGGIHYSSDSGENWTELNNHFNVTQYYDADKHPFQMQFIGGTQDNGTHRSPVDPDYTSAWPRVLGGDGFDCAWDKENDDIVYGTIYYTRVYRSTDGGNNFTRMENGLPESSVFHTPLAMDPSNSNRLFTAGNDNTFYWTNNSGEQWNDVYANYNGYTRMKIAVSESNPNIVWTGSTSIYTNVSTDGGLSFTEIPEMVGDTHAWLTGLHTHPGEDSTAFLTLGASGAGKVFRTRDLGQTWENLTNNLPDVPVHSVLVMPFDYSEIWLGTDIGLFISYNEGQTWEYADNGIPAVCIRRLKIVGNEIVAATHGRGIWSVYREEITTPLLSAVLDDLVVPNPNTGAMKIRFATRSSYDSAWVYINGQPSDLLLDLNSGVDTFGVYQTNPPEDITAQVYTWLNGQLEVSDQKTRFVYSAQEEVLEDFNGEESSFFGDLTIGSEENFDTPVLGSPHPYENATTYFSYMGIPVTVTAGAVLSYRDVALIEPGEEGAWYPEEEMWDYVAVEGSSDGDNWELLLDPYDARYSGIWEQAYNNGQDGTEAMMLYHDIDLITFYSIGEKAYFRFRLYADAYTTGWGWAIDDVEAVGTVSAFADADMTVDDFRLLGNYPNPFNPSTVIRFTVDAAQPVSLVIYNSIGERVHQLLYRDLFNPGSVHEVTWNGRDENNSPVASGMYYYELKGEKSRKISKMLLLK